jgi:hypothetical protein
MCEAQGQRAPTCELPACRQEHDRSRPIRLEADGGWGAAQQPRASLQRLGDRPESGTRLAYRCFWVVSFFLTAIIKNGMYGLI